MDFYSNNRILDWEARRRVNELRGMSRHIEPTEEEAPAQRRNAKGEVSWNWRRFFHHTNPTLERA